MTRPPNTADRVTGWVSQSSRRPESSSAAVALLASITPAAANISGMTMS